MPKYLYKCESCSYQESFVLPISSDPKEIFGCTECHRGSMTRRIVAGEFKKGKQTLGKWFKSETGKDFMSPKD